MIPDELGYLEAAGAQVADEFTAMLLACLAEPVPPLLGDDIINRTCIRYGPRRQTMITIAQQGRTRGSVAEKLEDVVAGVGCWWVEINGTRISADEHGLCSAQFAAGADEFSLAKITLEVVGPVKVVYLGPDGHPLVGEPLPFDADDGEEIGGGHRVERLPAD